jgi:hypothetical protein
MSDTAMIISKQLTDNLRLEVIATRENHLNVLLKVKGFDPARAQEAQCRLTIDEARFVMDMLHADPTCAAPLPNKT